MVHIEPEETEPGAPTGDPGAAPEPRPGVALPQWALPLALVFTLFLIYAPSFTVDYLALDELAFVGRQAETYDFRYLGLAHGRPLAVWRPFVYEWAGFDPVRIQFVRFASFAFLAGVAVGFFRVLKYGSAKPFFAFFAALLLFSQLPFQGTAGFSLDLITAYLPPMALSLFALWLHYRLGLRGVTRWKAHTAVLIVLTLAVLSGQTWGFFSIVPLSFMALSGNRPETKLARSFIFLTFAQIAVAVLATYIGLKVLHDEGREGYAVGEEIIGAVTDSPVALAAQAVDPRRYWSAFKLWTYPFPFHNTPESPRMRETLGTIVMGAWALLFFGGLISQLLARGSAKKLVLTKWSMAVACVGFGAAVVLADSPFEVREARPHITTVLTGACIMTGGYAMLVLRAHTPIFRRRIWQAACIAVVLLTALGAQTGVLRNQVDNRADQLDFIRTELSALDPADYDRIVVVLAPQDYFALREPSDNWSGKVVHFIYHARRPERYEYALHSLGLEPGGKELLFVTDDTEVSERDLVVDWRKYLTARKNQREHFPWKIPFAHRRVSAGE